MNTKTLTSLKAQLNKGNNREILLSPDTLFLLHEAMNETQIDEVKVVTHFSASENKTYLIGQMGIEHTLNTLRKYMKDETIDFSNDNKFFSLCFFLYDKICQNIALAEEEQTQK